jgi:hypothetical protein
MATMGVDGGEFQVRFSQKENRKLRNNAPVTIEIAGMPQVIYAPSKDWRYSKDARSMVRRTRVPLPPPATSR